MSDWPRRLEDTSHFFVSFVLFVVEKKKEDVFVRTQIVVDDREQTAPVLKHLRALPNADVEVRRLKAGDYLADDCLLFERKTVRDFGLSMRDGRLFKQARRLAAGRYRAVYILEGNTARLTSVGVRREGVQGAIIALTIMLNIPLLRSLSPEETARLIYFASDQLKRLPKGGLYRAGRRPKGKRRRQLFILQGLPGIGPELAERLLDTFGSAENVFGATRDELAEVHGIGDKTAKAIRMLVSEEQAVYSVRRRPFDQD